MFRNAPEPRGIKGAQSDKGDLIELHLIARTEMIGEFPIIKNRQLISQRIIQVNGQQS
jgi:hypothetical protein